jgi:exonuclease III
MKEKKISFNYGSLNGNSLVKTASSITQSFYIRYLREQKFDILSLQETHATPSTIPSMDTQFQAQQTFWTYYCGIVSFSNNYILTQINTAHIFQSDRFLLCKVHHPHQFSLC